ncbi:hypothetical protein I316_02819 [Kwoniella heveanensis BCC8398]|uniref:Uncharacterized protein n=1 Tax=Kwoniella heveanensis BCC8398 TaxID=1296120 RepID=A0A1B9GW66_9TREE|nr:hypothetical protein I316_02819 [Kwoniella heveanensis BCC8398]
MYHRHVARHPNQWGLIYPILDLISGSSFHKTICQSGVAGPLSLGSIPVSLADNHFSYLYDKPQSASAGLCNLRVIFHININGQGRLLSPYSPVVPGAANLWYVEYDQVWDEWEINHWDDTLDWRANLHHCIPVQDAIIQFSHSMHANANTTLTIYSLNDSAHVKARKDAVHSNRPDLRHSIETLCGKKEPWMKDLSKITTPRRFGPFNMYRISTQQGIELMDVVVGGLKVRFKDFSPDDGDEACPACKGDR